MGTWNVSPEPCLQEHGTKKNKDASQDKQCARRSKAVDSMECIQKVEGRYHYAVPTANTLCLSNTSGLLMVTNTDSTCIDDTTCYMGVIRKHNPLSYNFTLV